ncbi:N-acetyltransferase [Alginatibacterium sediminis]|uniref:N-acetyltransferase n=1 Tax=Alginatibacterium sediminis TaxID=2164068 RepID=A0A420E6H7_9ALTE|nr:GNAT family N-acetyltransferase [Alginatibacterium sediminis]RKF13756.1 N-acetyltransferase [Alginatibacterium sediminis]
MFCLQVDEQLKLALVQSSFAEIYLQLVSEDLDYLKQWLAWPSLTLNQAFFERFVQNSLRDYADGKSLTCAMIYQNELVGNISFNEIDQALKSAQIGYWLCSKFQGKGIVTSAAKRLIQYGFEELNLDWIQINAAEHNIPSRAVAQRLGFDFKTIALKAELINGDLLNHAIYMLEKGDYQTS